ncbi:hypothetical protein NT6N_20010 [Oceaniferula spumae]|uniref:HEAT repeat domain-containing protein n=1 Tax=Oceaniferula spumae TaxID=2979115 RepID=A0AAT9FM14_9BACT
MAEKSSLIKLIAIGAALGLAFWFGRVSSSASDDDEAAAKPPTRSTTRAPRRQAPRVSLPGAGQEAITTAADLRAIFKRSGGNIQRGTSEAKLALAAMNGLELARLIEDLATTQAATPGYSYQLEIQMACSRWAQVDPEAALAFALSNKQSSFRQTSLTSIFGSMAELDPNYAKKMLSQVQDPTLRRTLQYSIVSTMAISHPDAWLAEVKANPSMANSIGSAVSEWAVDDPVATASRIGQLPKSMQASAISALATIWAGQDRKGALAWAGSLKNAADRDRALGSVAAGVAAQDPDAALTLLSGLDDTSRRAGISAVFKTLIDRDFDGAMDRALAITDEIDQATAIKSLLGSSSVPFGNPAFYMSGSSSNAEQINKLIQRLPEGSLRKEAITALSQRMSHYSLAEAENILANYTEEERSSMKLVMINTISYSSPERALEIYQSLPDEDKTDGALSNIVNYLSRNDPQAALDLALKQPSSGNVNHSICTALSRLSANDPIAALRRLDEIPDGQLRTSAISSIASSWSQQDPESALGWAEGLGKGERVQAMCNVIGNMANNDPKKAAKTLEGLMANADTNDFNSINNASRNIISNWGKSDPSSAADWIGKLPDSKLQNYAVARLASQWVPADMERASQWIETLPDGQARDAGVAYVIQATRQKDPSTSFAWANSLSNQQSRYSQISYALREWNKTNPKEARAAAMRADVTESQRENLLRNLK